MKSERAKLTEHIFHNGLSTAFKLRATTGQMWAVAKNLAIRHLSHKRKAKQLGAKEVK